MRVEPGWALASVSQDETGMDSLLIGVSELR